MGRVICPFCLAQHELHGPCPSTGERVPAAFVREYDHARPLWLASVGLSAQARAPFMAALTTTLDKLSLVFEEVYADTLDTYTADAIQAMRLEAREGRRAAPAAEPDGRRPLLLSVYNMPLTGSHCLVLYDLADDPRLLVDPATAPIARQCATTWFVVSLSDPLEERGGRTIADRFRAYRDAMERLDIDLRGRNLVVVYTESEQKPAARQIRDYLRSDPIPALTAGGVVNPRSRGFTLPDYLAELEQISEQLQDYTRTRVEGGAAFINMVKARGMRLRFCVTSAPSPAAADGIGALREEARSYRVLDPFFWSIELDRQERDRAFQIAVDASSPEVYARALHLWEAMAGAGSVTTYQLGQLEPLAAAGQRPPEHPPRADTPRLIGPILEQLPAGSKLVVWAGGPILDLADFPEALWRDRITLVTPLGADWQGWPTTLTYRPADRPEMMIETLLQL